MSHSTRKPIKWPVRPAKIQGFNIWTAKTLIRLGGCPSSLGQFVGFVMLRLKSLYGLFQKYTASTLRRYNDFLAFHELLMMRFPYRIIPRLPPKKMMGGNGNSIYWLTVKLLEIWDTRKIAVIVLKLEQYRFTTELLYPNSKAGELCQLVRSDAPPPDMRTVGVRSSGSATFFHGDRSWNNVYNHSSPTTDSSKAVVSC